MEGHFETFAPIVAFSTVLLFLVMALLLGWYTCSADFVNAFVQATLHDPIYNHLPRGFHSSNKGKTCLKLLKRLYGLTTAPRLWHEHLLKALLAYAFVQSSLHPCLFLLPKMFLILYCDDLGIAAKDESDVDNLIQFLRAKGFELTKEGTFSDFLGIKREIDSAANIITLTQHGLIKKILKEADMTTCNGNWTPASTTTLAMDEDGDPMNESWNYRSIAGMLLYSSGNTRPDITFAVSQVSRFTHAPKASHATAVKKILRYLSRTIN